MKHVITSLIIALACLHAYAINLVTADFENPPYQMGPVMGQQDWITAGFDAGNDVTNVNVGAGAQSLLLNEKIGGAATYSMVRLNISNAPGYAAINTTQQFMRISFMVRPDSTYDAIDIRNAGFTRMILAPIYTDGFQISGDASAKLPCTYAAWQTVSVLLDCLQNKAIQITRNSQTGTVNAAFGAGTFGVPAALRFSTQYSSPAPGGSGVGQAYFDNISVDLEPAFRMTASATSLPFFQNIVTQTYTVSTPYPDEVHAVTNYGTAPWIVSVTPATANVGNSPVTITVVVNHGLVAGPASAAVVTKAGNNVLSVPVNNVYDTYYVAPTGNDANDGISPGTPFQTLAHAVNVCGNGTVDQPITIVVAEGAYAGECTDPSGTNWVLNFDTRSHLRVIGAGPGKSYLTQGGKNWFIQRNAQPSGAPDSAPLVFKNATGVRFSGFTVVATNPPATNSDHTWFPDFFSVVSVKGGNGLTLDNLELDCRYDGPVYVISFGVWTNDWKHWYGSAVHFGSEGTTVIQPGGVLLENILWRGGACFAYLNGYNGRDTAGNTNLITIRNCTMVEGIDRDMEAPNDGRVIHRHGPVVYANHARYLLHNNVLYTHPRPAVPNGRDYFAVVTDNNAYTNRYGDYTITLVGNVLKDIGKTAPYARWCNNFNNLYFPPGSTNLFSVDPVMATVDSRMYVATGVFGKGWYLYSSGGGAGGNLAAPSITGTTNIPGGGTLTIITNGVVLTITGAKLPGSWLLVDGTPAGGVGYNDTAWSVDLAAPLFPTSADITYLLTAQGSPESQPTTIIFKAVPEPAGLLMLALGACWLARRPGARA